jgi:uncharacterized protein (TIGR00369 family)
VTDLETSRTAALAAKFGDRFDPNLADAIGKVNAGPLLTGVPEYLGMRLVELGPGLMVWEVELRPELLNPAGVAHGAVVASLVDHTLGSTIMPLLPAGSWPATLEFKLNYLAPAREGILRARGEVQSMSKRTGVVSVECTNGDRSVAMALGTIAITPPKTA